MRFLTDPIGWWYQPFAEYSFMREALGAAVITVIVTSVVGTWVVLRGMSFLGEALGHGVLPGVAIAFVLGGDTQLGALVAALALLGGVQLVRTATPLPYDATVGVLYVGFLALAIVVLSSREGAYAGELDRFLFGSILGIDGADLLRQGVIAAVTIAGVALLHRPLLAMTFSETRAQLWGLRPRTTHAALMVLLALTVVVSYESVGSLLVFAFLVGPAAGASLLVGRVPLIMVTAVGLGTFSAVTGLLISFHSGTAAGGTMALVVALVFVVALAAGSLKHRVRAAG